MRLLDGSTPPQGPPLWGLFGRESGTADFGAYSDANKSSQAAGFGRGGAWEAGAALEVNACSEQTLRTTR